MRAIGKLQGKRVLTSSQTVELKLGLSLAKMDVLTVERHAATCGHKATIDDDVVVAATVIDLTSWLNFHALYTHLKGKRQGNLLAFFEVSEIHANTFRIGYAQTRCVDCAFTVRHGTVVVTAVIHALSSFFGIVVAQAIAKAKAGNINRCLIVIV
jgi:hypothetical protein